MSKIGAYIFENFSPNCDSAAWRHDLAAVVELHLNSLSGSLFSRAGRAVTRCLYSYAARSRFEIVLVARDSKGGIIGASVVSLSPNTLIRRLLSSSLIAFHLALCIHKLPLFQLMLNASGNEEKQKTDLMPELMFLFVDNSLRSEGVGGQLLERTHQELVCLGIAQLEVFTESQESNRALAFYLKKGYLPAGTCQKRGRTFCRMVKELNSHAVHI
jgi:hypothetical protein